jgi:hypothetical protein
MLYDINSHFVLIFLSLQSLLGGNPKDKVNRNEKSGIYEIIVKIVIKNILDKQNDRS